VNRLPLVPRRPHPALPTPPLPLARVLLLRIRSHANGDKCFLFCEIQELSGRACPYEDACNCIIYLFSLTMTGAVRLYSMEYLHV
jgi:hypothetical protein